MSTASLVRRGCVLALATMLAVPAFAQQGWTPYQFETNEQYKYALSWTRNGETSTGWYSLQIRPADGERLRVEVRGELAGAECSAAVTVDSAAAIPQHLMMACPMMAPSLMMFWGPAAGYWAGRELSDDDEWSFSHGDQSMSFKVEGDCSYAGQSGKRTVMRQNERIMMTACVADDLALVAAVTFDQGDGESMEATLVEYSK